MNRIERLLKRTKELGLESLFLNNVQNIRYISGYTGADSYILISPKGKWFITDYRYTEQAKEECVGFEVIQRNRQTTTLGQCVNQLLKDNNISNVGFEREHINFGMIEDIKNDVENAEFIPTIRIVEELRYTKDEKEVALIKKACEIADKAFAELLKVIKVGMTEAEAALELEYNMRKLGAEGPAFDTILISGAKASMPHGIPSDKKIEQGDFVTVDFGAVYKGYRSDMTRTFIMEEANDEQIKLYNSVLEAQIASVEGIKAGLTGKEAHDLAGKILERDGYYEQSGKSLGHGIGLDVHEKPFMVPVCQDALKEGCVVTCEPGVYISGWGGVRIEDTVVITKDGCEILTHTPKELLIVK